jgi:hypothetical protein
MEDDVTNSSRAAPWSDESRARSAQGKDRGDGGTHRAAHFSVSAPLRTLRPRRTAALRPGRRCTAPADDVCPGSSGLGESAPPDRVLGASRLPWSLRPPVSRGPPLGDHPELSVNARSERRPSSRLRRCRRCPRRSKAPMRRPPPRPTGSRTKRIHSAYLEKRLHRWSARRPRRRPRV